MCQALTAACAPLNSTVRPQARFPAFSKMEFLEQHWHDILGSLVALAGVVGFISGGLIASLGDPDQAEHRVVEGIPARMLSLGYVLAGASFFFVGPIAGIPASIILLALTYGLGKPAD